MKPTNQKGMTKMETTKQNQLTPDQIAELRRLLRHRQDNPETPISYTLKIAMFEALPALLAAAEREAKLREALNEIKRHAEVAISRQMQVRCADIARAALAEGGGK